MSETKSHQFKPPLYHRDTARNPSSSKSAEDVSSRSSEQQGWEAYRKWLSTVSGKSAGERPAVDSSIYSWKGYHNWADRVKQAWKPDEGK